ncbi:MAG: hypothetical protein ACD_27C00038G0008 [uncultured bacterium]|jgi:ribosomal protein L29|uniref:50S ribosomal protein L29 n=2 Tax=Candidatus Collieribacteriota TaxID=1752725 RepID=A0A1F5FXI6_9BACT|nr:MAG: hypothetical protein ACD_27C00038G0008 [uncultured bacterium]KKU21607.1 MAG: hypothetical protein UX32_C0001G0052 [Microgenomates group bacterium GW2011_GWF1_46_12]KKU26889.1 MAG: hypothetical protein UX38_C0002G0069 [Microgenomates group bacterium GW2011_GWC1_46_16]KKU28305.1 MAG: hypothetical protein UX40_C0001G0068 [Microgenomates group bacterium GW2011_GWF2_46_18]KKU44150.1 MAG: hypothetical protein UX59_C0003G0031 [Microgenomates group bacterium GW2011_GWA1_46_7]KKU45528.1 MAG: hy
MKKNERRELIKLGSKAVWAKIAELKATLTTAKLKQSRGEQKNLRAPKHLRRVIAQLQEGVK